MIRNEILIIDGDKGVLYIFINKPSMKIKLLQLEHILSLLSLSSLLSSSDNAKQTVKY